MARGSAGFTLLEMMLTVFLIGLAATLVALNIDRDSDDIAALEARRFAELVTYLQDESTFTGLPMAIEIRETDNRYRFWELDGQWRTVEKVQVLRERIVPDEITLEFNSLQRPVRDDNRNVSDGDATAVGDRSDTDDPDGDESALPPDLLMVEPTGLVRPFITTFRGAGTAYHVTVDNELNPVVSSEEI